MSNIFSHLKDKINDLTRDKSFDIKDASSYRSEEGNMVGSAEGQWDNTQPEHLNMIDSTAIQDLKYNPKTGDCDIRFRKGKKTYRYPDVPQDIIENMKGTPSKGRYFNYYIKPYSINK